MATNPNQKPVPSEDYVNMRFNAGKLDEFITSTDETYTDRLGKEHMTAEGIRVSADDLRSDLASSDAGKGGDIVAFSGVKSINQAIKSNMSFYVVGSISQSTTIHSRFELVTDELGLSWGYVGTSSFPINVPTSLYPNDKPDWQLIFIDDYQGEDESYNSNTTINSVSEINSGTVKYIVNDSSNFNVGKFCLIHATNRLGLIYCGLFKVTDIQPGNITVEQSNERVQIGLTEGVVYASPMNNVITSYNGAYIPCMVRAIRGVVIDCMTTSSYGFRVGGTHNSFGERFVGNIGLLSRSGAYNLKTSGAESDDVVGIIASNGSVIGVDRVAVNGGKIGIESYRNSCIIGAGVFVTNTSNDAFKNEFTCNTYIYYCHASNCGSAYSARYSSGAEFATLVAINCQFGSISQFNAYLSIRDFLIYKATSAGCYATDSSYLYVRGGLIKTSGASFRSYQQSSIESAGSISSDPITEESNSSGYDVQSSSFRHSTRVITGAAPVDTWDAKNEVIINSLNASYVDVPVTFTIAAGARYASVVNFPVSFQAKQAYKAIISDADLQVGLSVDAQPYSIGNARLYVNNFSASSKTLTSVIIRVIAI